MNISFQKLFFTIATIVLIFAILILAKTILVPIAMALILSFILFPLAKRIESWGTNRIVATSLSILILLIAIGGPITLFSTQIISLSSEVTAFGDKLTNTFTDAIVFFNKNVSIGPELEREKLLIQIKEWVKSYSGTFAEDTFNTATGFLAGLFSTLLYTFLFLIYRDNLTDAFLKFSEINHREKTLEMLKKIQKVGQKYLVGMLTLITILGFANSIGLWIIGIENPFLFGFLAAVLSIIPYVGTTIGACIPVLYAFMTTDSLWVPMSVAFLFWFVQLIESNFLSPKVVGGSLNVNALAAILSLIIGASVWGVTGMILFLPFTAMLKVFCEEFPALEPIALLIGSQNAEEIKTSNTSHKEWVKKLKAFFQKKKTEQKK